MDMLQHAKLRASIRFIEFQMRVLMNEHLDSSQGMISVKDIAQQAGTLRECYDDIRAMYLSMAEALKCSRRIMKKASRRLLREMFIQCEDTTRIIAGWKLGEAPIVSDFFEVKPAPELDQEVLTTHVAHSLHYLGEDEGHKFYAVIDRDGELHFFKTAHKCIQRCKFVHIPQALLKFLAPYQVDYRTFHEVFGFTSDS